jgi:hypothetical protein
LYLHVNRQSSLLAGSAEYKEIKDLAAHLDLVCAECACVDRGSAAFLRIVTC